MFIGGGYMWWVRHRGMRCACARDVGFCGPGWANWLSLFWGVGTVCFVGLAGIGVSGFGGACLAVVGPLHSLIPFFFI